MVLTNPPFGGKEGKDAQTRFAYKTGATQVLFLQHVIDSLKPGGRCGIVMDNYDLSDLNITKKQPLTVEHFDDFFERFDPSTHELSDSAWCVPVEDIQAKNYDLKAVNPNRKGDEDSRTPEDLLAIIESQAEEIEGALSELIRKGI